MTSFPRSPRLIKGGIVLLDPTTGAIRRVIALQYNPDTLSRTLQVQAAGGEGDRLEAMRLKGPPTETIKLDAEIDATDQLEFPDQNPVAGDVGIFPQIAALETIVYPTSTSLQASNALAKAGTLEIAAAETALTLFVWSKSRVVPVRITDFRHHRGSVRPQSQSDPRQDQPGHARAVGERPRLDHKGGGLSCLSAEQGAARGAKRGGGLFHARIGGIG